MKISIAFFIASITCMVVALSQLAGEVFTGFGLAIGEVLFGLAFIFRVLAKAGDAKS